MRAPHHRRRAGQTSLCPTRWLCFLRSFTSLCYSADGDSILAGGLSKFVCIYNVGEQLLVKKFEISSNLSLDAMEVSGLTAQADLLLQAGLSSQAGGGRLSSQAGQTCVLPGRSPAFISEEKLAYVELSSSSSTLTGTWSGAQTCLCPDLKMIVVKATSAS